MADWITVIETAAASGFGTAIGLEIFSLFKRHRGIGENIVTKALNPALNPSAQAKVNEFVRRETEI